MIRITYPQTISDAWRVKKTISETQQRRVYRWGATWAYANPWKVEKRTTFQETEGILIEICTPTSDHQPPYEVEDMWDEEVFLMPHIEYNGLLSLMGTAQEVQMVMVREGLPSIGLPVLATSMKSKPAKVAPSYKPSRCLITD